MGSAAKCCRRASDVCASPVLSWDTMCPMHGATQAPGGGEARHPGRGRSPAGGVAAAGGAGAPPDRSNSSGRGVCSGDRGVSAGVDAASLSGATCTPKHGQRRTARVHSDEDEHMQGQRVAELPSQRCLTALDTIGVFSLCPLPQGTSGGCSTRCKTVLKPTAALAGVRQGPAPDRGLGRCWRTSSAGRWRAAALPSPSRPAAPARQHRPAQSAAQTPLSRLACNGIF